jgi:hypothetical protein
MTRVDFIPRYASSAYSAEVQRRAVLWRCYAPAKTAEGIYEATQRTVRLWRRTLAGLASCGWYPRGNRSGYVYATNCLPTFACWEPRTASCRVRHLCPFCAARLVAATWSVIDEAVTACRGVGGFRLVERRKELVFGLSGELLADVNRPAGRKVLQSVGMSTDGQNQIAIPLRDYLRQVVRSRSEWVHNLRPHGAFFGTVVEPWLNCWHVTHRQLLLLDATRILDARFTEGAHCREHTDPNRRTVVQAVARTCAYPTFLLRGPHDLVAAQLRARQGLRLSATYGAFRQQRMAT